MKKVPKNKVKIKGNSPPAARDHVHEPADYELGLREKPERKAKA